MRNKTIKVGPQTRFNVSNLELGDNITIGNKVCFMTECEDGYVKIGNEVQIDSNCLIDCSGGLIIGDRTHISMNCTIYTHTHGYDPKSCPAGARLTIANDNWIGENSTILQSVSEIRSNNIIGYGTVVTKDISCENKVCVGNPIRFIDKNKLS